MGGQGLAEEAFGGWGGLEVAEVEAGDGEQVGAGEDALVFAGGNVRSRA